ncbi:hypothetical protein GIB67_014189 [Kingdonia uniflora]|uniref:PsbP C-terminal domain-containing protein n=1 Tax=Kingdonia uniflora TaxID=39325 RepID=A0A7J7M202_9MAGN|nr:hypothetical protein GIB67_014189 [Kingdonia uniflora]
MAFWVIWEMAGLKSKYSHFQIYSKSEKYIPDRTGRRQALAVGAIATCISLISPTSETCKRYGSIYDINAVAAEAKKGFLSVLDKKDGYEFLYPFGWQEVVIEGQDKVFKDVIEPLETVSVNLIQTSKQDIKDLGSPHEVAEVLIKKVLAPPSQKTKLIEASEVRLPYVIPRLHLKGVCF